MNKCTKYEALYTFGNEETLKAHLETCEECKKEQEQLDKVSDLLKEVKPYYIAKRKNIAKLKAACALFVMLFSGATLGVINFNTDISDTIKYGNTLSAEDLGFPVDSYGLIMVE
jgi:hypothetical protein